MKLVESVRGWMRNFVLGPGVVEPFESAWGHQPELPVEEYGNYLLRSPIYTCVTKRANMLKGLPFEAYRNGRGGKVLVERGALYELLQKVNPFWTFRKLLEYTELSLCMWGEAYWFLERGMKGTQVPREIWWGRPDRVRLITDEVDYINGYLYFPMMGSKPLEFAPGEVIRFSLANVLDEFSGLSPVAPLQMASDLGYDAMSSNRNLFKHGMMGGGMVLPPKGATLTREQAAEVENKIEARASGVDRSHRWTVMRYEFQMAPNVVTPRDAEFLGTLNYSLEEAARVYGVPLDMVGGQRTYENVQAAERAIWTNTLKPEADDIADTITEFLVPMFPGEADEVRVNYDEIDALHESEDAKWERERGQIECGAITINEWREERGMEAVPWGDEPKQNPAPDLTPAPSLDGKGEEEEEITTEAQRHGEEKSLNAEKKDQEEEKEEEITAETQRAQRALSKENEWAYGGAMHRAAWDLHVRRLSGRTGRIEAMVQELFRRQMDSVKARVKSGRGIHQGPLQGAEAARHEDTEKNFREEENLTPSRTLRQAQGAVEEPNPAPSLPSTGRRSGEGRERGVGDEPFVMAEWVKKFREAMRVAMREMVEESGDEAMDDLGIPEKFQVNEPLVRQFIEGRAQRFAVEVNETTWEQLRTSIGEGIAAGEGLTDMMARVDTVMGDRINSSAEIIARTEVGGAMNGGKRLAWKQSGVVTGKRWIAELDDRVRDSHSDAHGQVVGIDDDFEVGAASGPGPGEMGDPDEDINCRCTMTGVIDEGA